MIELYEKSRLVRAADDLVDGFFRKDAVVAVATVLVLKALVVSPRVADGCGDVIGIMRVAGEEIDMDRLLIAPVIGVVVDGVFHGGQRHEMLVRKAGIIVQDLVIAEGDDVVAVRHIAFLDLLRGETPVREKGMTMQIRLAPMLLRIDKILFHAASTNAYLFIFLSNPIAAINAYLDIIINVHNRRFYRFACFNATNSNVR